MTNGVKEVLEWMHGALPEIVFSREYAETSEREQRRDVLLVLILTQMIAIEKVMESIDDRLAERR